MNLQYQGFSIHKSFSNITKKSRFNQTSLDYQEADEKILLLSEKITALVAEAETAGCNGNVEQAQGLLKLSDQLREEREDIRKSLNLNPQYPGSNPLR